MRCMQRYLCCGVTFVLTFLKEKSSKHDTAGHSASGQQFVSNSAGNHVIGCHLGPTIIFYGCHLKVLTKLPWKSDRSDTVVGERQQLCML